MKLDAYKRSIILHNFYILTLYIVKQANKYRKYSFVFNLLG